jgi:hypothetical protein
MSFTTAEKVQAAKFVNGYIEVAKGMTKLGAVARTHGHLLRPQLYELANNMQSAWSAARHWFSDLSGTPRVNISEDRTRAVVLANSKLNYEKMMHFINGPIANIKLTGVPEFADAFVNFKAAQQILTGFDWTLSYANPRHDDVTPFEDALTIVGPHGDWSRATAAMKFTMWYLGLTWRDILGMYKNVPVYVEEANGPLGDQLEQIAHIVDCVARVYSMHIEVESPRDAAIIDADFAHDSGARIRPFHRAMLQNELLFNFGMSEGVNHYGRPFEVGGLKSLELKTWERFFLPLAKANTPRWVYEQIIADTGQFGGPHAGVTGKLTDFWQIYDSWAQAALGFYHVMPSPTIFKPKVQTVVTIPAGFFDQQAAEIGLQLSDLEDVDASIEALKNGINALEGTEV